MTKKKNKSIRITIMLSYITKKEVNKTSNILFESFQKQFKKAFPDAKLSGTMLHIEEIAPDRN